MQPDVTQDPNAVLNSLSKLILSSGTDVPVPTLPGLNVSIPSGSDVNSQWNKFLQQAANDPSIVKYYNDLLSQAKGDTALAIDFLKKSYQQTTSNVMDNLKASLESLGLTFTGESNTLENTLNKRGIALTQGPSGTTPYAGGGQPATEVGNLKESQGLRQEAEQRTAKQNIEGAGLTLQKGETTAGQQLQSTAMSLQKAKQQDVGNLATQNFNTYIGQQNADANKKLADQSSAISGGSASTPRSHINPKSGVWDDNYYSTGNTG